MLHSMICGSESIAYRFYHRSKTIQHAYIIVKHTHTYRTVNMQNGWGNKISVLIINLLLSHPFLLNISRILEPNLQDSKPKF